MLNNATIETRKPVESGDSADLYPVPPRPVQWRRARAMIRAISDTRAQATMC